jgi:M6 family metalloprotease-like protein
MATAAFPAPDTLRTLAILVDFEDEVMGTAFEAAREDSVRLYFQRVLVFLKQTYLQMSDSLVVVEGELTPRIYRMPRPQAFYGLDDSIATREAELCRDAVEAADPDVDFRDYDRFVLFHAGPGQEADINDDSRELIWSVFFRQVDFAYWLDAPDADRGIRTEDGYVTHMVVVPEYESQDGYAFGILGVVAHEFGHSFGLPDLYDTTAPADFIYADSQGIGAFGLMGAGIWNANGFFPAEMEAWSKFYVGWVRPEVERADPDPTERALSLASIQTDRRHGAVRIPLGGDEYFLIENRVRDYDHDGVFDFDDADGDGEFDFWTDSYAGCEFDWHLPRRDGSDLPPQLDGSGLLVWHIDESIIREFLYYNMVNAEALHKGVDLEEADGIQDLDKLEFTFEAFGDYRDAFWAPYSTAFTPETNPNTDGYGDAHTGIWIRDISGPGPAMTFTLGFADPQAPDTGDFRAGWPLDLPALSGDFQPVSGDLDGDGVDEIVISSVDSLDQGGIQVLRPDGTAYFDPGTGPALQGWGKLRAEPILVNLDGAVDPRPELVWVSGDSVLAVKFDGRFVSAAGSSSAVPVPYYLLDEDPGRIHIASGFLEPPGSARRCGDGPQTVNDDRPELLVPVPRQTVSGWETELLAIAWPRSPGLDTTARTRFTLPGEARSPEILADIDSIDGGLRERVASARTASGGYLAVTIYDRLDETCVYDDPRTAAFSLGDSVAFTPPVAGDVNRDGLEEIVFADSRGFVHVVSLKVHTADGMTKEIGPATGGGIGVGEIAFDNELFDELPGWPVEIGSLADDELSLADVDGDGYLEILAFGPANTLHVLNYNGTSVVSLPVGIPAEDRYVQPFLAPMVLDLTGDDRPDLLLPLPDGQVRGHDTLGRPLPEWAYLGGGNQGLGPLVDDLDGDGRLELVTVEDVTVAVPEEERITVGDDSPGIVKRGRVGLRDLGPGTGNGPWAAYRHDAGRTGVAGISTAAPTGPAGLFAETFVVPNPVTRRSTAGFHYLVRDDVDRVKLEILTARGESVRVLDGTLFRSTDNLVPWDLNNDGGKAVAPGLYFARLQAQAGSSVEVRTLPFVLIR